MQVMSMGRACGYVLVHITNNAYMCFQFIFFLFKKAARPLCVLISPSLPQSKFLFVLETHWVSSLVMTQCRSLPTDSTLTSQNRRAKKKTLLG